MSPTRSFPNELAKLLSQYKGKWVTLSYDEKRILGYGASISEALEMAKQTDPNELPLLIKVPDEGSSFVLL